MKFKGTNLRLEFLLSTSDNDIVEKLTKETVTTFSAPVTVSKVRLDGKRSDELTSLAEDWSKTTAV